MSNLDELRKPLTPEEIDWKVQRCGRGTNGPWAQIVPYADARAVQNRLDAIVGPANWQAIMTPTTGGMLCNLQIKIGDEWVGKMDGSDETDYEPFKGSISKALVRAAVHWGIGRELYDTATIYAQFVEKGTADARHAKIDGADYYWIVPQGKSIPKQKEMVIEKPTQPAAASASSDDFDNEVITFGKFKGQKMIDVGAHALAGYYEWLKKNSDPNKSEHSGMKRIAEYVASRTTKNIN